MRTARISNRIGVLQAAGYDAFVRGEVYGTRATTLIAMDYHGSGRIIERRFGPQGVPQGQTALHFGDG